MKKKLMKGDKNKSSSNIFFRYEHNIWFCCGFVCIVVISLTFYNQGKSNEYKQEKAKLESTLIMQDSIKLEMDKDKILKLQTMNQQLEKQTDTLSSQLSALTTEIKSIKRLLKTFIKKGK